MINLKTVTLTATAAILLAGAAYEAPRELARWFAARALEDELDGRLSDALVACKQAVTTAPKQASWRRLHARLLFAAGRHEDALQAVNRALELRASDLEAYPLRASILQSLGRFEEAVTDWKHVADQWDQQASLLKQLEQLKHDRRAFVQNGLAYARALAGVELDAAEADALAAIDAVDDRRVRIAPRPFILLCAASSYVEFHRYREGLTAAAAATRELRELVHRYQSRATAVKGHGSTTYAEDVQKLRAMLIAANVEQYRIYRELDLDNQAAELADIVGRLNGNLETDGWGVSLSRGYEVAQSLSAYLDTLGYVRFRQGRASDAAQPLDHAERIAEVLPEAHRHSLALLRRQRVDVRAFERQSSDIQLTVAVTTYHRGLVYQALGENDVAAQAMERVRSLGYEPGPNLF